MKNDTLENSLKLDEYQKNCVTVSIWASGMNPNYTTGTTVGHISVRTPTQYMSLWPKLESHTETMADKNNGLGIIGPIPHELVPSLHAEVTDFEKRPPELTLNFYTLKPVNIEKKFSEIKESLKGWAVLPSEYTASASCASLAWRVLQAGGIEKYLEAGDTSRIVSQASKDSSYFLGLGLLNLFSTPKNSTLNASTRSSLVSIYPSELGLSVFFNSPDQFDALLKLAKQRELRKESLTKEIKRDGEWLPQESSNNSTSNFWNYRNTIIVTSAAAGLAAAGYMLTQR